MGVPTVTIATDQFLTLARGTKKSQGLTDMCFVTVPHPIGMLPKEQVDAKVDAAFGDIVKAATQWQPVKEKEAAQESPYPAKTFKFTGTYADVNKLFAKRKWSLSLPIIPPTVDRVREMLKGTKHAPSEVLWVVPPRQGMLTVELVAVLGVMAGAQPEHMPLLLATIDAMKAPEAAWRGTSTTTAPTSPLIVISGPIVEKLKLNAGTGTAGGENPVTNALGYFVNLVGDVVGGSVPPNFDKSTQGSSFDLVANVICENAKETPWDKTFAEEQGFTRDDSVVTISTSYLANANIDHDSVASEDLLNTFSAGIAGSASGIASCLTVTVPDEKSPYNKPLSAWSNSVSYAVLVISPEHAATMYRDMKSKDAIRDYLVKNTVLPYKFYTKATCVPPEAFGPTTPTPDPPASPSGNPSSDDRLRRAGQAVPVLGAFPAGPEARFREDRRITPTPGPFTGAPALFSERARRSPTARIASCRGRFRVSGTAPGVRAERFVLVGSAVEGIGDDAETRLDKRPQKPFGRNRHAHHPFFFVRGGVVPHASGAGGKPHGL